MFANALELKLEWLAGSRELARGGFVRVGWDERGLRLHSALQDDCVFTGATADHQHMWELGDVFELFLKFPQRDDYFELHATPPGHRLQLHFPDQSVIAEIREGRRAAKEFMVTDPIFEFLTRQTDMGWEVLALVPTATLGLDSLAGTSLLASFSRYDYSGHDSEPMLSSTSRHEELNFHRIHEWTPLEMVA